MTEVLDTAIILSGGKGTRLFPNTLGLNKHLLPIYSKPMVYYPVALAMLLGIKKQIIICNPNEEEDFKKILGFSKVCGLEIDFIVQRHAAGILDAISYALPHVSGGKVMVLLGDNIFFGSDLIRVISCAFKSDVLCHAFSFDVYDPSRFGIVMRQDGNVTGIIEKPQQFVSYEAITGLYIFNVNFLKNKFEEVYPSSRGELEVTSIIHIALQENGLIVTKLPRGTFWVDAGLLNDLSTASEFVKFHEQRTGKLIYCPEEIAFRKGWIDKQELTMLADEYPVCDYQNYLKSLNGN